MPTHGLTGGNTRMTALLSVRDLSIGFGAGEPVVKGVTFDVEAGQTLALVGESGSGKTISCRAALRILPRTAQIRTGTITLNDSKGMVDLTQISEREMRGIRGNRVSMIFQEPMRSLSPLHKIGNQVSEVLWLHRGRVRSRSPQGSYYAIRTCGIPRPAARL